MSPPEQTRRPDRLIRRPAVREQTGLTDSALDREIRAGRFPKPVKLSADPKCRAVGFSYNKVQSWIADRLASHHEELCEQPKHPSPPLAPRRQPHANFTAAMEARTAEARSSK